jgi:hypothetical protein
MVPGSRLGFEYLPNTTDWYGRWRLTQNPSNDWMIDRAAQKSGEIFTGIASIHGQDQAVTESMGGITDHERSDGRPHPPSPAARRPRLRQGPHRSARRR